MQNVYGYDAKDVEKLAQDRVVPFGQPWNRISAMNNPWKWIAVGLGIAFICLLIFTVLVVNGIVDLGFSLM